MNAEQTGSFNTRMSQPVTKYLNIVGLSVQSALAYRTNFFVRAAVNLVPLLATVALWQAIYQGGHAVIGGYTLAQMISYYVVVTMVDALTAVTEDDWQIAADIKDGHISQFLVKPVDYLWYRLCLFISGRLVYSAAAVVPVVGFLLLYREHLVAPADGTALAAFIVSVGMSALLQFLLCYLVAMLAFWVLEISTFTFILLAFERMASGQMFPLDILPPALAQFVNCLPFAYQSYFPVSVYLGRISGAALAQGLIIQALWVVALYLAARWVWGRGLRSYAAVSG
jgi:ABC-2 type transport system permease protein